MSLLEEETQIYQTFPRHVATGINFFRFFSVEPATETTSKVSYATLTDPNVPKEKADLLAEYVKQTLKDIRKGKLNSSEIQRRMYWFLSKIYEFEVFPTGQFYRFLSFYQISLIELDA